MGGEKKMKTASWQSSGGRLGPLWPVRRIPLSVWGWHPSSALLAWAPQLGVQNNVSQCEMSGVIMVTILWLILYCISDYQTSVNIECDKVTTAALPHNTRHSIESDRKCLYWLKCSKKNITVTAVFVHVLGGRECVYKYKCVGDDVI